MERVHVVLDVESMVGKSNAIESASGLLSIPSIQRVRRRMLQRVRINIYTAYCERIQADVMHD